MLRGDIDALAKNVGVSKTTIYKLAEELDIDLAPLRGRCRHTVDYLSGRVLQDERDEWLRITTEKMRTHYLQKLTRRRERT